ncbi:MAG TPA: 4Fe-4S dicluster domain-containing protein [Longimicrobiales bacterium]|nr:4Fe-4S dicluster domain-containing protein [Longimicrobiales bacterium]
MGAGLQATPSARTGPFRWGKLIDHGQCIGCHACTTACKSENEVPLSVTRTYVKYVDVGVFPETRRAFQVTRCNQCEDAPCVAACPTAAMYRRVDGIVDFDKAACIGCKACIAACPYDAIFINPEDHSAEKCNFCAHRLDVGLEPACVTVCPTQAIKVGDLNDPASAVAKAVNRDVVAVRRPEKETRPTLFYRGAHQATLDPLAARRPGGGLYMWSEQGSLKHQVPSGHPGRGNSSAAAVLSYDIPHRMPWDWRVSLYTWTKGIAAGAYLVPLLLILLAPLLTGSAGIGGGGAAGSAVAWSHPAWLWAAPVLGGAFLGITGLLLIWDLEHPARFWFILARPQWRSWLARGAVFITVYAAVLAAHFGAALLGAAGATRWLAIVGAPFAAGTALYTAYLFAQSKARDLWQNPLAPGLLFLQALLLGAGALEVLGAFVPAIAAPAYGWVVAAAGAVHVLLVLLEHAQVHATAHAHLAARAMTHGRYAAFFWPGMALLVVGAAAPWLGAPAAAAAMLGLLAYEHAYVQAGQSVPLA